MIGVPAAVAGNMAKKRKAASFAAVPPVLQRHVMSIPAGHAYQSGMHLSSNGYVMPAMLAWVPVTNSGSHAQAVQTPLSQGWQPSMAANHSYGMSQQQSPSVRIRQFLASHSGSVAAESSHGLETWTQHAARTGPACAPAMLPTSSPPTQPAGHSPPLNELSMTMTIEIQQVQLYHQQIGFFAPRPE